MKQNYLKKLMTALLLLCCTVAGAADFEVGGIYYNILSDGDKTVEVTSGSYAYTGAVTIPASVTYNDEAYSVKSIGNYAFYDCAGLTSIELPEGVTSIGNYAFCGCTGLTSVEIPSSVTSIGNAVFYDCAGLTSIEIFANLTSIGSYVFIGCTGLTSVVSYIAAEDLFAINAGTFSGIDNDACTLYVPAGAKSTYAATNGWKKFTNIVEFNGKCGDNAYWALNEETGALTIFGTGAMYNYTNNDANRAPWYSNKENITSVTIEEGVTSIGDGAFAYCYGLTSIEIPSSVTSIGQSAFHNCSGLTSIEIPSSVTSIGNSAFGSCHGLTSIEIPSSVTSIGQSAFHNCSGLTSIVVDEGNSVYDSRGNCNAIIETASNTLIAGCVNTIIPAGVTSIGYEAFAYCSLTSIEIPSSVTSIGNDAFWECDGLTSIEIPSSVTSIGNSAFSHCDGLTSIVSHIAAEDLFAPGDNAFDGIDKDACTIYVPTGAKSTYAATEQWKEFTNIVELNGKCGDNAYWALNEGALTIFGEGAIYDYADNDANRAPWYSNRENITSVTIEEGVTSIGNYAFDDCDGLTSVEIPSSVTSIGDYAFAYCDGLTSIEIPSSVTSIDDYAFYACTGLTSIVVDEGNSVYDSRGNCNAIIKTASNTLILGCKNTIIPEGVTSIGESAFYGCDGLTSIEIPEGVTSIGQSAFCSCIGLTSIEIPEGVTSIGNYAFYVCPGLTSIEIPSSVTSIGDGAFVYCSGLTSIVVGDGNSVYDSRGNCNAIIETASNTLILGCKNTIIPEGVTSIGSNAFAYCDGLTSVEIPSSVTSIGNSAFYYCTGLTSVVSCIAAENLFAPVVYAFDGIDKDACTLYVPAGAKSTYAATDGWKEFKNIVEMSPAGYSLTVTAAGYATLYLDKAVKIPAGVEAYTAGRIEGDFLKMQAVEDVIPANTAVIIKAEEGTYSFAYSDETPDAIEGNLLRGTLIDTYIKPASAQTAYVLSKVDGVVGMYRAKLKADGTFKNNANRVYMLLGDINVGEGDLDTSNPGGQLSNGYRFDFSGTTAIESVETESAAPAVYYDLSGRRVENPEKGIYIVNGRKVFIK